MANEPVEMLPHLTDEELEQLFLAVGVRIQHMRAILATSEASAIRADAEKALLVNLSLSTAISEARLSLAARREKIDEILANITKAAPGEDGLCMHCHKEVRSVPGGRGPVFVHSDSQMIPCL